MTLIMIGAALLSITGCGSANNVHSNRLIKKRKYNKGWHFSSRSINNDRKASSEAKVSKSKESTTNNIAIIERNVFSEENPNMQGTLANIALQHSETNSNYETEHEKKKHDLIPANTKAEEFNEDGNFISVSTGQKVKASDKEKSKINARRILSIIGWSIVLIGAVFAIAAINSWSGGVAIGIGIALVGFILLLIAATKNKIGASPKEKSENAIGQTGFFLIFIASLLGVAVAGFLIGLAFWSNTVLIIATAILLLLDIIVFILWKNKRKNHPNLTIGNGNGNGNKKVYSDETSNILHKKDEHPAKTTKSKWKRLRTGSFIALGIGVGFIAGSFIFSSWLYFAIILTFGIGLIALLISLILGLIALSEKRKLPKVEKEKKESTYPRWKIFGWIALGFFILGVALIIVGLGPMSGIASPAGSVSILIAIIFSIITLIKGIKHKKNSPKQT